MADAPRVRRAVVFGAGVTGLSVAHELAERGFAVDVVEAREHPLRAGDCQVGGMARTQWSRVPKRQGFGTPAPPGLRRTRPALCLARAFAIEPGDSAAEQQLKRSLRSGPRGLLREERAEIYFAVGSAALDDRQRARIRTIAAYLRRYVEAHVVTETVVADGGPPGRSSPQPVREKLYVVGFTDAAEPIGLAQERAEVVMTHLARDLGAADAHIELESRPLANALADDHTRTAEQRRCVAFVLHEVVLPGEHGYRFFPAFYRHLFDTMRRTPILNEVRLTPRDYATGLALDQAIKGAPAAPGPERPRARTRLVESGRTVFDNLVSVRYQQIEQADPNPEPPLSRVGPPSLTSLREAVGALQEDLGFEWLDLLRFQLKILQYVTSSSERRAQQYEQQSWVEFLGSGYSRAFTDALSVWPQALVGMRAHEADARTFGSVTVQLLLDQIRSPGFRDGTLNAPTSVGWLGHWRRYLGTQGVRFHRGRLRALAWDADAEELRAEVEMETAEQLDGGYFVLALPVDEAYRIVKTLYDGDLPADVRARHFADGSDLARLLRFLDSWSEADNAEAQPRGPLQHFSGIQYYLEQDFSTVEGHTYYANSTWGLTSISQVQFRVDRPDWREDHRGLVSVDVGNWYARGRRIDKRAWDCSRDEVALEVWYQMMEAIAEPGKRLPAPLWYHVDDDVEFARTADGERVRCNSTPFLLNRPGEWGNRPGRYDVSFAGTSMRGLVLAGTYMQTATRLVCMETANESARRAVNAILADCARREPGVRVGHECALWDIEEQELDELKDWKELDRRLLARGLPHILDILEIDDWLTWGWPTAAGVGPASLRALVLTILDRARQASGDALARLGRSLHTADALLELLRDWTRRGERS